MEIDHSGDHLQLLALFHAAAGNFLKGCAQNGINTEQFS
jgi:hypothetical protein